jgi:hypothetical protein
VVTLVAGAGAGLAHPDRAGADDADSFTATALAQGMRASVVVPRFLVTETLADIGAAISQTQLSTVGGKAYASSLFPGDTAIYGQVAAALGLPPPPPYPLEVAADHPSEPEARADPPGQAMSAEAGPAKAESRAAVLSSSSDTTVEALDDGSVVARAQSVVEGAAFPGNLHIARIHSVVTTTLAPGASTPTVEALTTVTGASIDGTAVTVGPDGIAAPEAVGLPPGTARTVEESLARGGTTVRRIKGEPIAGGASSDVIEVRSRVAAPGLPEGTLVYRLAGATASVLSGAAPSPPQPAPPVVGDGPGPTAAGTAPGGIAGPATFTPRAGSPAASGAGASSASAAPPGSMPALAPRPPTPAEAGDAAVALPEPTPPVLPGTATPARFDGGRLGGALRDELAVLYLVLILGGLAAFAAASILRQKGVNRSWSS